MGKMIRLPQRRAAFLKKASSVRAWSLRRSWIMDGATRDSNTAAAGINLLLHDYMGFFSKWPYRNSCGTAYVRRLATFI